MSIENGKQICDYCGAVQEKVMFCIGASTEPEWTMVEGTGKMTCPNCYDKAMAIGQAAVDRHCKSFGYKG